MKQHPLKPGNTLSFFVICLVLTQFLSWESIFDLDAIAKGAATSTHIAVSVILAFFYWAFRVRMPQRQRRLNEEFSALVGSDESFALYLRSFRSKRVVPNTQPYADRLLLGETIDVELALSLGLYDVCPLVAIGDAGETLGASKVLIPDAAWREKFFELTERSAIIFVAPDSSQSLLWEITTIIDRSDLLSKTWFLMPPGEASWMSLFRFLTGRSNYWRWRATRAFLQGNGFNLPVYASHGLIFRVSSERKIVESMPWSLENSTLRVLLRKELPQAVRGSWLRQLSNLLLPPDMVAMASTLWSLRMLVSFPA